MVKYETKGLVQKHYGSFIHPNQSDLFMFVAVDHIHVYSINIYPRLDGLQCHHDMAESRSDRPIALGRRL